MRRTPAGILDTVVVIAMKISLEPAINPDTIITEPNLRDRRVNHQRRKRKLNRLKLKIDMKNQRKIMNINMKRKMTMIALAATDTITIVHIDTDIVITDQDIAVTAGLIDTAPQVVHTVNIIMIQN